MLISCRKIKKSFGDKVVLNSVDLDIGWGDRIGLVGPNGAGKTTLANILTGDIDYDEGSITSSRQRLKVGYLRQTENDPELFLNIMKSESGINGELQRLISNLGMQRVKELAGERLQNLSGGEKTKLALAAVWAAQPEVVILDEPTNHMDYQGIRYLIGQLQSFAGAVLIISHDRYFLDQTVNKIAEIENGLIKMYPGNYSAYRESKRKERESQQHTYESQQKEQRKLDTAIAQLKGWSDKAHRESRSKAAGMMGAKEYYRNKAKKHDKAVKSQLKRLEKMRREGVERPQADPRVIFNVNALEKGGRRILQAESISKAFEKLELFRDSSFYVNRGERIGIFGPNGCGKTTLVRIILGQESLDKGRLFLSQAARIAYVSQEMAFDEVYSVKDLIKSWTTEEQKQIIQILIQLGIAYDRMQVAMGDLSRGEHMKIATGLAIMGEYDLLILDEPTNHLDIFSREALEETLLQFPGTIVIVSHDRYLLEQVCDHLLVFEQQRIIRIEGKLTNYLNKKQTEKKQIQLSSSGSREEKLLLETRISRVLSELSLLKPEHPKYAALETEYQHLLQLQRELNGGDGSR